MEGAAEVVGKWDEGVAAEGMVVVVEGREPVEEMAGCGHCVCRQERKVLPGRK